MVAAAAAVLVATAAPALAHVTVSSPDASPGEFGKLVFRVPNESDKATTTKVSVTLPATSPFASVSAKPLPGWTVATTTRPLAKPLHSEGFTLTKAVATVTWTAKQGQGLPPGQFDEFELSVGPFPKKPGTLSMPAVQTYSDGSVIHWDQATRPGRPEPDHPAPTLDVSAATPAAPASGTADPVARWLAGAGLLVAVAALVTAVVGRGRRQA